MTNEELKDIVGVPFTEVGFDAISPALEEIDQWLDRFKLWGINNIGVDLRDFEIQGILTTPAATPFPFVSAGPQIVFRHKSTGKSSIHQAYPPPMGRQSPMFHFATAAVLVQLAQ